MGWNTWNDVGGSFCTYESGAEIGIIAMVRKILDKLYEVFVSDEDFLAEPVFDLWLRIPTGHEIRFTAPTGKVVPFNTWIPKVEYCAVLYKLGLYTKVAWLPKKSYASFLDAILAPLDCYVELPSSNVRRLDEDDNEQPLVWGVLSDTLALVQWFSLIFAMVKVLHLVGLAKIAVKMTIRMFKWIKARSMHRSVESILNIVTELSDESDQVLELLDANISKLTTRRIMS